jgi:hypothetical protein
MCSPSSQTSSSPAPEPEAREPKVMASLKRLEQRARQSWERLPYPSQIEELFVRRVQRLRGALDFATKADVKIVTERIEQLHEKMDHFVKSARHATPTK